MEKIPLIMNANTYIDMHNIYGKIIGKMLYTERNREPLEIRLVIKRESSILCNSVAIIGLPGAL